MLPPAVLPSRVTITVELGDRTIEFTESNPGSDMQTHGGSSVQEWALSMFDGMTHDVRVLLGATNETERMHFMFFGLGKTPGPTE